MQAKEYWVIMCDSIHEPMIIGSLVQRRTTREDYNHIDDYAYVEIKHSDKNKALAQLAELTAQFPNTVYTLYHLVPTEHTTHKR